MQKDQHRGTGPSHLHPGPLSSLLIAYKRYCCLSLFRGRGMARALWDLLFCHLLLGIYAISHVEDIWSSPWSSPSLSLGRNGLVMSSIMRGCC